MPLPTAYTDDTLAAYMRDAVLQSTARVLGLTALASFAEAVNNAVLACEQTDIAACTDIPVLRAWAAVAAWEVAQAQAAGDYAYSADGASWQRQQVFDHIKDMLDRARAAAVLIAGSAGGTAAGSLSSVALNNQAVW